MKLTAIVAAGVAVLASPLGAAATYVVIGTNNQCPLYPGLISKCGNTPIRIDNWRWASVTFTGAPVNFWSSGDCAGQRVTVSKSTPCQKLPFRVRCVSIKC
jgi:hypothetical protein